MEMILRSLNLQPNSYDPTNRTAVATISTGYGVRRRDANGPYTEFLDIAGADLSRLRGAPVLDNHSHGNLRNVLGTVDSVSRENGALSAVLRFSSRDDVAPVLRDIQDGILRGVSLGYSVSAWRDGVHPQDRTRTRTATKWIPHEVSIVPVPADPAATIRSEQMLESVNPETPETPTPEQVRASTRAEIRTIARSAGLSTEWADSQIDSDADVTAVRAAAFDEMQKRSNVRVRTQHVGPSNDDPSVILERRADALFCRLTGATPKPEFRDFMADSLVDHARGLLAARGEIVRTNNAEAILTRAAQHGISDFPNLLTSTGSRVLMAAYTLAASPLKALCRQGSRTDFRPGYQLRLGELGTLGKATESGEIKSVTRGEAVSSYALETFGSIFSLSRKAIINDDLSAFSDWGTQAGRAAAETENQLLVTLFTSNPNMEDNVALFNAAHGNLAGSGAAISAETLGDGRLAMRKQKDMAGNPINAAPRTLFVPAELESVAQAALADLYPPTTDDVNVFAGSLTLAVEPRLTDDSAWYLFADGAQFPVIEYAYLASQPGPQMASRDGFDVLGREFRVTLDFGAGPIVGGWRGAYKNAGA